MDNKKKKEALIKFGKRLSQIRKAKKLSFRELATLCDVDYSDLKKYEKGEVNITIATLIDISIGLKELQHVKSIHIIAVNNEVKELLWILERNYSESIQIKTTSIKSETNEHFEFALENEVTLEADYSEPLTYLYEPNAAVMKSGGFKSISKQFNVNKLHKHSHLYTSDELMDFPGRIFKIETVVPYNKKSFKTHNIQKANITTRNFPETVETIRKKLNIKDGGDEYLFFTTNLHNEKICLICKKTQHA